MQSPGSPSVNRGIDANGRPHLRLHERLAYSVGHFYNDLCASMWFSYLLIYLHYILKFQNKLAGYLLLLGQIVDAVSTPLIGYESDRVAGFFKYGKRKSWHMIGTVLVTISFPFLFLKCVGGENSSDWAQFIYYAPFVTIFQIGWAATQIAHLALVNEIAFDESERVGLNAFRNAFTLLSSVVVYGIAWGLFGLDKNAEFGESDVNQFMILAFSVVGIGLVFSVIFHIVTPELRFSDHAADLKRANPNSQNVDMTWLDWLKEWQFYLVALAYMFSRLVANVSQTYWPLYLTESLKLSKVYIAIIPLVVFVTGFFSSLVMRPVNRILGRKLTFAFGLIFTGAACIWIWFLNEGSAMEVFGPAILLGAGSSTLLVTSLSMVADLIGPHSATGAFVYGSMSFADKLSSGLALVLVQFFHPCNSVGPGVCCAACSWYYRSIMVILPATFAGVCFIFLLVMVPMKIGNLRKFPTVAVNELEAEPDERRPLLRGNSPDSNLSINNSSDEIPISQNHA